MQRSAEVDKCRRRLGVLKCVTTWSVLAWIGV
jgi:hypothetical protein